MSKKEPKPHSISYTEEVKRRLDKIAAVMDLEDHSDVWLGAFFTVRTILEKFSSRERECVVCREEISRPYQ